MLNMKKESVNNFELFWFIGPSEIEPEGFLFSGRSFIQSANCLLE